MSAHLSSRWQWVPKGRNGIHWTELLVNGHWEAAYQYDKNTVWITRLNAPDIKLPNDNTLTDDDIRRYILTSLRMEGEL